MGVLASAVFGLEQLLAADPLVPTSRISLTWERIDHSEGVAVGSDGVIWAGGEAGQIYRGSFGAGYEIVSSIPDRPLGFAVDSAGVAYCTSISEPGLYRIEPTGESKLLNRGVADRLAIQPNHPAVTPSSDVIWSDSGVWGSDNGCLWITHQGGHTEVIDETCCRFPNGLAISPDGRSLAVVESTLPGVSLVELGAGEIRVQGQREVLHTPGLVPDGVAWDINGDLLISFWAPDAIVVLRASGAVETVAYDPQRFVLNSPTNLAFIPGTRNVLVASYGERCLSTFEWTSAGAK